jgi:hypothetical protein
MVLLLPSTPLILLFFIDSLQTVSFQDILGTLRGGFEDWIKPRSSLWESNDVSYTLCLA